MASQPVAINLLSSSDSDESSMRDPRSTKRNRSEVSPPTPRKRARFSEEASVESIEDSSSDEGPIPSFLPSEDVWMPSPPCAEALHQLATPTPPRSTFSSQRYRQQQTTPLRSQHRSTVSPRASHSTPRRRHARPIPSNIQSPPLHEEIDDSSSDEETSFSIERGHQWLRRSPPPGNPLSPTPHVSHRSLPRPRASVVPEEIIESSDEEDNSLFQSHVLEGREQVDSSDSEKEPAVPVPVPVPTPPQPRQKPSTWLQSVATPENGTQGDSYVRRRKGEQVTRLHRLIESKKTEEMAAKHIIASRQHSDCPPPTNCVVLKAGRIVGNLYKTVAVAVDSECDTRPLRVMFPTEQKIRHGLEPGVMVNLIPPWQEFSVPSGPAVLLCNTFEVIHNHVPVQTDPSLVREVQSPVRKQQLFCSPASLYRPSPTIPPLPPQAQTQQDAMVAPTNRQGERMAPVPLESGVVQGTLLRFLCPYHPSELEAWQSHETSLSDWFDGLNIKEESERVQLRLTRKTSPAVVLRCHDHQLAIIEIPVHQITEAVYQLRTCEGQSFLFRDLVVHREEMVSKMKGNRAVTTLCHAFLPSDPTEWSVLFATLSGESEVLSLSPHEGEDEPMNDPLPGPLTTIHQLLQKPDSFESHRVHVMGKVGYTIPQCQSFSTERAREQVFLFDSSHDHCTNICVSIEDPTLASQMAEMLDVEGTGLLFRDLLVSYELMEGRAIVSVTADRYSSVVVPEEELAASWHALAPHFAVWHASHWTAPTVIPSRSIFTVQGTISSHPPCVASCYCADCDHPVTECHLSDQLQAIQFCTSCCAIPPTMRASGPCSLTMKSEDDVSLQVQIEDYQTLIEEGAAEMHLEGRTLQLHGQWHGPALTFHSLGEEQLY